MQQYKDSAKELQSVAEHFLIPHNAVFAGDISFLAALAAKKKFTGIEKALFGVHLSTDDHVCLLDEQTGIVQLKLLSNITVLCKSLEEALELLLMSFVFFKLSFTRTITALLNLLQLVYEPEDAKEAPATIKTVLSYIMQYSTNE